MADGSGSRFWFRASKNPPRGVSKQVPLPFLKFGRAPGIAGHSVAKSYEYVLNKRGYENFVLKRERGRGGEGRGHKGALRAPFTGIPLPRTTFTSTLDPEEFPRTWSRRLPTPSLNVPPGKNLRIGVPKGWIPFTKCEFPGPAGLAGWGSFCIILHPFASIWRQLASFRTHVGASCLHVGASGNQKAIPQAN